MRRLKFEWEPRPSPGAVWSKRPRIEYLSSARHTAPFRTVRPANPANQRQCGVRQKSGPPLSSSQNHQANHRGTQAQRKGKHARAETRRRGVEKSGKVASLGFFSSPRLRVSAWSALCASVPRWFKKTVFCFPRFRCIRPAPGGHKTIRPPATIVNSAGAEPKALFGVGPRVSTSLPPAAISVCAILPRASGRPFSSADWI